MKLAVSKNLLSRSDLPKEEKERIPEHLLKHGVMLASTGWGMSGSGGSIQWQQKYLIFDKSTGQVCTLCFDGMNNSFNFSQSKAVDVSEYPLNVIESK